MAGRLPTLKPGENALVEEPHPIAAAQNRSGAGVAPQGGHLVSRLEPCRLRVEVAEQIDQTVTVDILRTHLK